MIAPIPGMAPPIPTNRSPAYFTITPPMAEPAAIPKLKKTEIREEARFTTDLIAKYKITYPVAYNCEGFQDEGNRQYALSQTERTGLACAFLDEVAAAGYTPMFYASRNELAGNASWDTDILASRYKIWLAWYPSVMTEQADYSGSYAMWQYTCQGTVDGISGKTDINTAYFSYTKEADPVCGNQLSDNRYGGYRAAGTAAGTGLYACGRSGDSQAGNQSEDRAEHGKR